MRSREGRKKGIQTPNGEVVVVILNEVRCNGEGRMVKRRKGSKEFEK